MKHFLTIYIVDPGEGVILNTEYLEQEFTTREQAEQYAKKHYSNIHYRWQVVTQTNNTLD